MEGVHIGWYRVYLRFLAHGEVQESFRCFCREMIRQIKECVLSCLSDALKPVLRDTVIKKLVVADMTKESRFRGGGDIDFDRDMDEYLFHAFPDFDDLCRASPRVCVYPAALCPCVGVVVMVDVAHQNAAIGLVDDHANVAACADRPEILVLRFVDAMEAQRRMRGVELQIEHRRFDGFLFLSGQFAERSWKGVSNEEVHLALRSLPCSTNIQG